jgi:4'-phosphopantetheinyl transferase
VTSNGLLTAPEPAGGDVALHWRTLAAARHDLRAMLDAAELARIDALERAADRGRSLVAAATVREAAGERLGIPPEAVRIDRTCDECGRQHGAPRLLHPHAPWVSVSHSGLLIAVVLADAPVGVDVQRVADLPEAQSAREWVRAEAILKATGVARAAGVGVGPLVARDIDAPLPGYAAALALPAASGLPRVRTFSPDR